MRALNPVGFVDHGGTETQRRTALDAFQKILCVFVTLCSVID
jgi:hypothetical protein